MIKKLMIPAAAALAVLLSALASAAVWNDSPAPFTINRSFLYVFFTPGQPVGTTVADVCVHVVHRCPSSTPNIEFERVFQADLDRIGLSLQIREIDIVSLSCSANAALIVWAPRSPHLSSQVESALRALPYVQFLGLGLAGEPDGLGVVRRAAANDPRAGDGTESPRRTPSWGEIKVLYR